MGVAGVEGNGQSELSDILSGLLPVSEGSVLMNGNDIKKMSIRQIRQSGTSLIHEDRMIYGVSEKQSIKDNIFADRYFHTGYNRRGVVDNRVITDESSKLIGEYQVACDGPQAEIFKRWWLQESFPRYPGC